MKITELRCTACNGTLKTDENNPHIAICEYCGSKYVMEQDDENNVHLENENWHEPKLERPLTANTGRDTDSGKKF